jgi:hypothetical protein
MTADDQQRISGEAAPQSSRSAVTLLSLQLAVVLALVSPRAATAAPAAPSLFETFEAVCLKAMPDLAAAEAAAKSLGLVVPEDATVEDPALAGSKVLLLGTPPDGVRQVMLLGSSDEGPLGAVGVENRICNVTATARDESARAALRDWLGELPAVREDDQTAMYLYAESSEGRVALKEARDSQIEAAATPGRLIIIVVSDTLETTGFTLVSTLPDGETR